jgi:hypothetical protein
MNCTPRRQQAAALNQDGTVNGADNPAARGSTVTFFGSGYGPLALPCPTGGLNPNAAVPLFFTGTPIQLPVQYGGAARSRRASFTEVGHADLRLNADADEFTAIGMALLQRADACGTAAGQTDGLR